MEELKIRVVTKDEFKKILLDLLVANYNDWSPESIFEEFLREGFPKLDFDNLGRSLEKLFVYLPTLAVDIDNEQFIWIVSGNKATVVDKRRLT